MSGDDALGRAQIVSVVSSASGTGRTSAVVNVAWILASLGKKVLIADLDLQQPSARDYLRPFQVDSIPAGDRIGDETVARIARLVAAGWGAPELVIDTRAVQLHRYRLAAADCGLDMVELRHLAQIPPGQEGSGISELKAVVQEIGYDYVLIDHPVDGSTAAATRIALLSDVVVVCFQLVRGEIPDAVRLVESIQRGSAGSTVPVIAVPTRLHPAGASAGGGDPMNLLRAALAGDPAHDDDWRGEVGIVDIPYRPYGAITALAVLLDDPDDQSGLIPAYQRLAIALSGHEISRAGLAGPAVRARYRRGLGLEPADRADTVTLVYEPDDRPWAEWIQDQFEQVEARVVRISRADQLPPATVGGIVVVVVSPNLARLGLDGWLRDVVGAPGAPTGGSTEIVGVRVGGHGADVPGTLRVIRMGSFSEPWARAELLSWFGFVSASRVPVASRRFPGVGGPAPRYVELPPRNPGFVGRGEDFERLRDRLVADPGGGWVLVGEAGAGKSEIAKEYAHRFAHDYDIVWWIEAGDRQQVRTCLAGLTDRLDVEVAGDAATSVVKALAHDHRRWLLIYNNADDPAELEGLVPPEGVGHVIVTTRCADHKLRWPTAETAGMTGQDAMRWLRHRIPGLTDADAERVATRLERLPIALHLAAAWLEAASSLVRGGGVSGTEAAAWAAQEFLVRHEQEVAHHGAVSSSETVPVGVAATLAVSVQELQKSQYGLLAVRLAQLCAFLDAEISLAMLCSAAMLDQLRAAAGPAADVIAADSAELHRVLHIGARSGLFDLNCARGSSVSMHRYLGHLVRASMELAQREVRRQQVLSALVNYAPTEAEGSGPARKANYAELAHHLVPSGALDSPDRQVRQWVVQQIRFAYREGDVELWRSTADLAEDLFAQWTGQFGRGDELTLRLAVQLANLRRALSRDAQALELDESTLAEQRRLLGLAHPRTLATGRGRGGDLRGLGRFREALAEDQITWAGFRDAYGEDHSETLMAAHNLALSFYLVGDVEAALRIGLETVERRRRRLGFDTYLCNSINNVGIFLRDLGQFDNARRELQAALGRLEDSRIIGNRREKLRLQKDISIVRRLTGRADMALQNGTTALRGYREMFGEDHPETQACLLSVAGSCHAADRLREALELATNCLRWYTGNYGPTHPFTQICQVDLATVQHSAGDLGTALEAGRAALRNLRDQLGGLHPWVLGAAVNHAGQLAATGRWEEVLAQEQSILDSCREALGPDHPCTTAVVRNLALSRAVMTGHPARTKRVTIHIEVPLT